MLARWWCIDAGPQAALPILHHVRGAPSTRAASRVSHRDPENKHYVMVLSSFVHRDIFRVRVEPWRVPPFPGSSTEVCPSLPFSPPRNFVTPTGQVPGAARS